MLSYLSISQTAHYIGVSIPTLRRWDRDDIFTPDSRTAGNHRRYSMAQVLDWLGEKREKKVVGYARVSSHDQKNDLLRQEDVLSHHSDAVISDLGSGINFKKKD